MLNVYQVLGSLSCKNTLRIMYNTHCIPCTIHTARLVQYTQHTLYHSHCTPCSIHTAHLILLNLAGRLRELGSYPITESVIRYAILQFYMPYPHHSKYCVYKLLYLSNLPPLIVPATHFPRVTVIVTVNLV